ncbi:sigma-70-like protein [Promicromonospora sp. AC04]|uniref:sigma factor-like helix-turn-helix DNA-binding protein n=1 Tax=Promicromonospora sp. AC04 TaxID=2135723 RepID=UPI000D37A027|nr:sigma factor-like helix-turn-helix DNA-binding protein [Promicromonospora sp. AC04]PUB22240.1 sigma-70-like protein [Promicromonospora sp. AC04]
MTQNHYTVRAKRWKRGWELHIDDIGVTQVRTLATADRQVRDYLESLLEIDTTNVTIDVVPELGDLAAHAAAARQATEAASVAQREAAARARAVVAELRDAGLSVADVAVVLGVSRGRVSQLTH